MRADSVSTLVGQIGIVVELLGVAMLVALFALLRRYVLRRAYFTAWAFAWGALGAAVLSLFVRFVVLSGFGANWSAPASPAVEALHLVYQLGKLVAFACFVDGTRMYVAGGRARSRRRLIVAAAAYAVLTSLVARRGLNEMVVWQSPIAVAALGYCAVTLLRLPRPRRRLGSVSTGFGFAMMAVLWLVYGVAFTVALAHAPALLRPFAREVVRFNTYLDLLASVMLGYGMVVVLMEDAKREVDDAQAELRVAHDTLRRAALYDSLTESLNRRAFADGVGLEMARATYGVVVVADMDNLKLVNDHFGHAAGDRLLRQCADVIRATLRPYDKLYRWGGDEFLVVLPSARAADILPRLEAAIASADVFDYRRDGQPVRLQVSLGAADYTSIDQVDDAILRADAAMYEEKGRRKPGRRSAGVIAPPAEPARVARG